MAEISFYGALADGFTVSPAIKRAAENTLKFGLKTIKSNTPIKTGTMKGSWKGELEGYGIRWTNSASYSSFVEGGTRHMAARAPMARALPAIKSEFRKQLGKEIGAKLSKKISLSDSSPEVLGFSSLVQSGRQVSGTSGFKTGSTVSTSKFLEAASKYLKQ
jgi:hypothetical protein